MNYDIFNSPIGLLTVSTDGKGITSLHIEGDRYFTEIPADWTRTTSDPLLKQAKKELDEYFAGKRKKFDLPLVEVGTVFQQGVWYAISQIPAGSTSTYGAIAEKMGKPKAVRAVGTAVGRNPICIIIPCHRVLGGNGSMGGFVAGIERKKALLKLEGVL